VSEPGLWLQYDFGDGPMVGGVKVVLFVAWLAFSRFRVVIPIRDKTIPSVFAALDRTRRRGCSSDGKNDPSRSFGIARSTSPAGVASVFERVPLRRVMRSGERSYRSAPIFAVASASTRSWRPACSIRRNTSEWARSGSARTSPIRVVKADWCWVIVGSLFLLLGGNSWVPTMAHQRLRRRGPRGK